MCDLDLCTLHPQARAVMEWWNEEIFVSGCDGGNALIQLTTDALRKKVRRRDYSFEFGDAVGEIALCQPSSAAAERVFSLLNASFTAQQLTAMVDYIEGSIKLQYNKRLL